MVRSLSYRADDEMSRVCELIVPTVPPEAARLVRGCAPCLWLVTLVSRPGSICARPHPPGSLKAPEDRDAVCVSIAPSIAP